MKFTISSILKRDKISSSKDIINWWLKGSGFLNIFYIIYVIFHLTIIVAAFHNSLNFFLLPVIVALAVLINMIYYSGLVFELILSKVFKRNIDFNNISPQIKEWLLIISITTVLLFSVYDITKQ